MPPKKKARPGKASSSGAANQASAAAPDVPITINKDYNGDLQTALNTIQSTWPGIESLAPLPETGTKGHLKLTGFMSPFNDSVYDQRYAEGNGMQYTCGCNFFWHNPLLSPMPWVPLYKSRVMELADHIKPGLLKHPLVWHANFVKGSQLPAGGCVRVSPDEAAHALIFKIAQRLDAGITEEENTSGSGLSCRAPSPSTVWGLMIFTPRPTAYAKIFKAPPASSNTRSGSLSTTSMDSRPNTRRAATHTAPKISQSFGLTAFASLRARNS